MAINLVTQYPGRAKPADAEYPYGSMQNESVPGAKDGTPIEKAWGNDVIGFLQSLLSEAGITPSGTPDKVGASDYLTALKTFLATRSALAGTGGASLVGLSQGGTVQDWANAHWAALYNITDPRYGASPSKTAAENTAAIQAAMAAVSASGGVLAIPPGNYSISGDCGIGDADETKVYIYAPGAVFTREATTSSYTMFSFRQNMTVYGLRLVGHVSSGTGWADVVPASSFGFRASSGSARNVLFINCEADGLPYDGWYIGNAGAQVKLLNCIGQRCYRNDLAAVSGESIEIDGGVWGYNPSAVTKVAAIDIEPNSGQTVNKVRIKNLKSYHRIDLWAAAGDLRSAEIDGVVMQDSAALLSWYRVKDMKIGEVTSAGSSAVYDRAGVPTVTSGSTNRAQGAFTRQQYHREYGPNLLGRAYNTITGYTHSSGGTNSRDWNHAIGDQRGIRLTNTGGGYALHYKTITVSPDTWYTFGGLMQPNAVPSGGEGGFYVEIPTLGSAKVWLSYTGEYVVGAPVYVSAAIKIPAGVTSVRVGYGSSSGTQDNTFAAPFFVSGIVGEVDIDRIVYASAAPTIGTWEVGDRVINSAPAVGQPKAWVCTVAGTPGTWVSEGAL